LSSRLKRRGGEQRRAGTLGIVIGDMDRVSRDMEIKAGIMDEIITVDNGMIDIIKIKTSKVVMAMVRINNNHPVVHEIHPLALAHL
jgi:hypothetical protein